MKTANTKNVKNHLFLIIALGITCTIGYGTLFYSFSILSIEIENHFAWSKEFIYGSFSLGIIASACFAPWFGRLLDRYNARLPMTIDSLVIALGLVSMSFINSKTHYVLTILLLEIVTVLVVYDSAFVALTQTLGKSARRAITQITLMGGFASTIFWPLIKMLLEHVEWQTIYILMALLHICVCLPLHWQCLKRARPTLTDNTGNNTTSTDNTQAVQTITDKDIPKKHDYIIETMIALSVGGVAFCVTGMQIHIFTILSNLNIAESLAVIVSTLFGPSQVVARVCEMTFGQKFTPLKIGLISSGAMFIALTMLILTNIITPQLALVYAFFFGIGQGLNNIVQGTVPLYIFGDYKYGTITGRINGVKILLSAAAPITYSIIMNHYSVTGLLLFIIGIMMTCFILVLLVESRFNYSRLNNSESAKISTVT